MTTARIPRRGAAALLCALLTTSLATTAAATAGIATPAEAAGVGALAGRVTNTSAVPLEDMDVTIFEQVAGSWAEAGTTETAEDGTWELDAVPTGTYRLEVEDAFDDYTTRWWRDALTVETATDIGVVEGPVARGYDVVLGASPTALVNLAVPQVLGSPAYGSRLTASPGTWSQAASFTYEWSVSGQPKLDATGPTFKVPQPEDPAKASTVLLMVTATAPGLEAVDVYAEPFKIAGSAAGASNGSSALSLKKAPTLKGAATRGGTLVLRPGRATPRATATYQWLRGARAIRGATRKTYRPGAADVGHRLRVRVTFRRTGFPALVVRTRATTAVRG